MKTKQETAQALETRPPITLACGCVVQLVNNKMISHAFCADPLHSGSDELVKQEQAANRARAIRKFIADRKAFAKKTKERRAATKRRHERLYVFRIG